MKSKINNNNAYWKQHSDDSTSKMVKYLFLTLILLFAVSIFFHTDSAITQDLGRHLTLGKIIWQEKKIPTTNLFSYTYPDFPFINHHWGSEVIFYLVYKFAGINGLLILKLGIVISIFALLALFILKRASFPPFLVSSLLTLEILRERTEVRPEIFAYLIFVLFLLILYKKKEKKFILFPPPQGSHGARFALACHPWGDFKAIWFLPVLQILWVNLHISFVYGLALYFLFLADRIISKKVKLTYFILGGILLFVTLLNPFGVKGVIYPLTIFRNYGYSIVENQSPLFLEKLMNNPTIFYFKLTILLFLFISPFLLIRRYFFEVFSVYLTGILSFWAIRNFPFFALSLIFPLSLGFTDVFKKINSFSRYLKIDLSLVRLSLYLMIIIFLFWEIYNLISDKYYRKSYLSIRSGFGQVVGLKHTIDFFQKNNLPGPIFNNFDIGSYLIYRLYPEELVFVDGRPEGYPASFFQEVYIPMQEKIEVWNKVNEKYNFQTIIFSHNDMTPWARQFLRRIVTDSFWQLIYFDDYGVILIKRGLLEKTTGLMDTKEKIGDFGVSLIQKADKADVLMRLANFFHLEEFADLERLTSIKLQKINQ